MTKYNIWFFSSLIIALVVALPVLTVFFSFFSETSNYYSVLKSTFLYDYILNSVIILFFVIIITFFLGVFSAYFLSFYEFPFSNFLSWALILAFAIPGYIYAFSIIAFFENYGTAFSLLTFLHSEFSDPSACSIWSNPSSPSIPPTPVIPSIFSAPTIPTIPNAPIGLSNGAPIGEEIRRCLGMFLFFNVSCLSYGV